MKRKQLLYVFPMVGLLTLGTIGCQSKGTKVRLWTSYSTENLLSDWDYLNDEEGFDQRDKTLRFKTLKNEHEGVQLMITPNEFVNYFDFEINSVTSKEGHSISKDNFKVYATRYIEIDSPYEKEAYSGWYPDAIVPIENYKWRQHNYIQENRNQSIYIDLLTPGATPAGLYTGSGTLTLDDKTYNIPIEVKVYNNELPEENHLRTCFLIWYYQIGYGELKNNSPELQMEYYNFAVDHRISPGGLPESYESNFDSFTDYYYRNIANNPRISNYRAPFNKNTVASDALSLLTCFAKKNVELRKSGDNSTDMFKKIMYYVNDEPTYSQYDDVRKNDKAIAEAKRYVAKTYLSSYPDLYESCMKVQNLVTVKYNDELVGKDIDGEIEGGVQTWCPQFTDFNTSSRRELYRNRQNPANTNREYGENVWFYGCIDPRSPYPSYHLDADLITSRAIPWMQFNYGIDGQVFWNICYYSTYRGMAETPRDVWNDPVSWEGCPGDGQLVYPGLEYGINSPISTLRFESIQAGNEEYEYLYMIDNYVKQYNETHSSPLNTQSLLKNVYSLIYKNVQPTCDHEDFEYARESILEVLEAFSVSLEDGVEALRNL